MEIRTIVNEILQSCTYILTRSDALDSYLVDCGDAMPVLDFLKETGKELAGVFITHAHYDHIYGIPAILKAFPSIRLYGSANALDHLVDEEVNLSYLYTDSFSFDLDPGHKVVLNEMDSFSILGETVKPIPTPGHSPDCLSYCIGNYLFTGDSYNPGGEVFTKWARSDSELASFNEQRLRMMARNEKLFVCPGHSLNING